MQIETVLQKIGFKLGPALTHHARNKVGAKLFENKNYQFFKNSIALIPIHKKSGNVLGNMNENTAKTCWIET